MKKYTFLFVVLIFVSTSFAAGIFALAGQAHALTLQHCTNEKWGGNVIVDIIGRGSTRRAEGDPLDDTGRTERGAQ